MLCMCCICTFVQHARTHAVWYVQKKEVDDVRVCRASLEQAQRELQATSKIVLEMRNVLQRHGFTDVRWAGTVRLEGLPP